MSVQVRLPSSLRALAKMKKIVEVEGATIDEVLAALVTLHPELKLALFDERSNRRRSIHVFLDDSDIRGLADGKTAVKDGQLVEIISAISGG